MCDTTDDGNALRGVRKHLVCGYVSGLQVMDYAVISDNKGRKVDFRNVVLIMTSNAGARYAHKATVGFESRVNAGKAMAKEVKNIFAILTIVLTIFRKNFNVPAKLGVPYSKEN